MARPCTLTRSVFERAYPLLALLLLRLGRGLQGEIEFDFGKPATHPMLCGALLVIAETDFGDQLVTGGVGKIVMQVLITVEVDLSGEVAMIRRRNKEVDMRRTLAMAAQLIEQVLGRTVWRAAIA